MNCSTASFPVFHYLPEFAQTHVHWVSDATQPSHLLSPPSPLVLNFSQHQGLFQWIGTSYHVAKILELQHQFFQWIFRTDFLYDGLVASPCSPRDSQESSPAPQFESINSSVLSFLSGSNITSIHDHWRNHSFDFMDLCQQSDASLFNMPSQFVKAFISRSKHLLISWLQPPSAMILECKKIKSVPVSTFSPSICNEVVGEVICQYNKNHLW